MTTTALTTTDRALATTDVMTAFGAFLRLYVADRDCIPRNNPKLLRQRGTIRGLVRGARHKSGDYTRQ